MENLGIKVPAESKTFCGVSYAPLNVIDDALNFHSDLIKAWAYIYHDKDVFLEDSEDHSIGDLKVPHFHFIVVLHRKRRASSVKKWFWCLNDDETAVVNTNIQHCNDISSYYQYLNHSRIEDKGYKYPESSIKTNDRDFFIFYDDVSDSDSLLSAYIALYEGKLSVHDCILRYGRDFIIHGSKVRDMVQWAKAQQNQNYI